MIISQISEKCVHWPTRSFTLGDFRTTRADRVSRAASCERVARDVHTECKSVSAARIRRRFYDLASPSSGLGRVSARRSSPGSSPVGGVSRDPSGAARSSLARIRSRGSRSPLFTARARDSPRCFRKTMLVLARSWMMCRRACWKRPGETSSRDDRCTSRCE